MKHLLIGKPKHLPSEVGEFKVFKYDDKDELIEASSLIFPLRGLAEQFMRDHVDPSTDPFVAPMRQKESTNGNQEGKDADPGAV
ncbi:hypothetical protein HNR26_002342 [Rhizobium rosettiformans]|uniref:Uncharacterized protein n=2 Tax=Rhizobium rosettiformans TaxID=1368430 RepID=A0A4S8Q1F6_9HYPH|nr:hypothetical protein [Rhizobium rosettiformans]MBB5276290.1 hypothetical protein [Rhizobium rosettiformans]THV36921.1 hypothetical protein FAA86_10525 [Rhizobium rosettiformans W3]